MMKSSPRKIFMIIVAVLALLIAACSGSPAEPEAEAVTPVVIVVTSTTAPETASLESTELPTEMPTSTAEPPEATATAAPEATATRRSILVLGSEVEETTEETPSEEAEAAAAATAEAESAVEVVPTEEEIPEIARGINLVLRAEQAVIEQSPPPENAGLPTSLADIVAPGDETWLAIEPGGESEIATYDSVRVSADGESYLGLEGIVGLLLKRDTLLQSVPPALAGDALSALQLDFGDALPSVADSEVAMHLLHGGFVGEKAPETSPVTFSTPNAVFIIGGTTFFVAYDPDTDTSWAVNFDGTMGAADLGGATAEAMSQRQLISISSAGRQTWALPEVITSDTFINLIDQEGSPVAAAEMLAGSFLIGVYSPELAVRNGPGSEFAYVGTLAQGEIVPVIGKGRSWWQIECPRNINSPGTDCWVSGGSAYTAAYHTADVPVTAARATSTPTATATKAVTATPIARTTGTPPTATPQVTRPPGTQEGDVFDCDYIGNDQFQWYDDSGGPYTGTWQSGCPASPAISFNGCSVVWRAGSDNVTSGSITLHKVGNVNGQPYDASEQIAGGSHDGSQSFSLPAGFSGDVSATYSVQLDNGAADSRRVTESFTNKCAG